MQEPRYYYFPGLPNIQFYEREQFPWMDDVEAETDAIRAELLEVMRHPDTFSPYVTGHANRPRKDEQGMLNNPDWSAFYFWKNGEPVTANLERCPSVMRALRNAPLAHRAEPLAGRPVFPAASRARTFRRTTGWSTPG